MEGVEDVVDDTGGDHEAGVDGAADDTSEGIPCSVVKPVVEIVEPILGQILGCAVVEIWIKLVNDGFKPKYGKVAIV